MVMLGRNDEQPVTQEICSRTSRGRAYGGEPRRTVLGAEVEDDARTTAAEDETTRGSTGDAGGA